jgi:hypothetical protein
MRSSSSSASGVGDVALCGLFFVLSLLVGIFVVTVLLVATSPLVSMFPQDSGAHEIVLGISLTWGVITGCVVAVFTIGPYRRMHAGAQIESFDETESLPLEMIGRPIARRRAANDRRTPARHHRAAARARAAADVEGDSDDELLLEEDELVLAEEAEMAPRRAGQRYRPA